MRVFRIVVCMIVLLALWAASVLGFAVYANSYKLEEWAKADGIIVLTGGGGRIEYGLDLLANARGRGLFISGVHPDVPVDEILHMAPKQDRKPLAKMLDKITLGRQATNTIGNAQESLAWVHRNYYRSVLLVTADYHMPRALLEFKMQLPSNVVLIPAPVRTRDFSDLNWVKDPDMRNLILLESHKLIAAKLRHLLIKGAWS
jgi:uncharacterized SAM-binding protein YcdF (DUF218 family)